VITRNGAFWFPKNRTDNPRIRPVATPELVQRAKKELQKTVRDLDPDRMMWRERIEEVKSHDDLVAISQLVRDLTILRTQRRLNQTEEKALNHFGERLLREWSATMNTDIDTTRLKLNDYLRICKERASV
jgi:RNA polymerase-interacting CarD/CdnL/TRCF family regulator